MDYHRPRRDGRLSWPGWLTHSGHFTNELVNHGSGMNQGKSDSQRPTSSTLSHVTEQNLISDRHVGGVLKSAFKCENLTTISLSSTISTAMYYVLSCTTVCKLTKAYNVALLQCSIPPKRQR